MSEIKIIERWKARARQLKVETYTLYLAYKDPRVPWYAKAFTACVVGYLFSPIDLIPDFIPILGYLDDLILVPLGIALALKMIPQVVVEECRNSAEKTLSQNKPRNRIAAVVIVALWFLLITWFAGVIVRAVKS